MVERQLSVSRTVPQGNRETYNTHHETRKTDRKPCGVT
jgi:hypothetical protein